MTNREQETVATPIHGMCCDCVRLSDDCIKAGYSCCDYSENEACAYQKADGNCWWPWEEE